MVLPVKRVLIIHPVAWARYKAAVFNAMEIEASEFEISFHVAHVCANESSRASFSGNPYEGHHYPFSILAPNRNYSLLATLIAIPRLVKLTLSYRPDTAIVTGYADLTSWAMLLLGRLTGIRVCGFFDSTELDKPRVWWKEVVKKYFVCNMRRAFAYGISSAEYLARLGLKRNRIVRRCQAADNEPLKGYLDSAARFCARQESEHSVVFGYVGRLAREKNLFVLIDAFSRLKFEGINCELLLVGDGPLRSDLEKYVKQRKISGIRFVGAVPPNKVGTWMGRFDVLVLPSISEPWGLVVNEAMFLALPVVVSRQCGCTADLIEDEVTGYSFSAEDAPELARILGLLATQRERRRLIGENGKKKIADYTPRVAAIQILGGLKSLELEGV